MLWAALLDSSAQVQVLYCIFTTYGVSSLIGLTTTVITSVVETGKQVPCAGLYTQESVYLAHTVQQNIFSV